MSKQNFSDEPFAEIIESSLHTWRAQSWKWDHAPEYAQLLSVTSHNRTMFGIVYDIITGSSDPIRTPIAYQKTEEELKQEQPQIFAFLQTTFSCLILGYEEEEHLLYQVAPQPAKIHSFVRSTSEKHGTHFFSQNGYLSLLYNNSGTVIHMEELLLALIKQLSDKNILTQHHFNDITETFSLLTGRDYRKLRLFLQRAERIITSFSLPVEHTYNNVYLS